MESIAGIKRVLGARRKLLLLQGGKLGHDKNVRLRLRGFRQPLETKKDHCLSEEGVYRWEHPAEGVTKNGKVPTCRGPPVVAWIDMHRKAVGHAA